ncbi:MAG: NAD-dependent epimerase/dehydratase family protein [Ilumatobacteraceae bacterium]
MADRFAAPEVTVVTGAAGWLGRALAHRLLADPSRRRLRLLAHTTAEGRQLQELGDVEVVVGDIAKPDTAARLLHGLGTDVDVIHTVGIIHPKRTRQFFEVNVGGARNVAEAALDHGIRRLVHVSSNSPFGTNAHGGDTFRAVEPYHPYLNYGWSKMEGELVVLDAVAHGLDATIVRPPWFYGPFQPPRQTTFFRLVRAGRFPVVGDGERRRSMVYIENLVDGVIAAELTPAAKGRGFWVADARAYTVNEIVDTVGRALRDEGFSVKEASTRLPAIAGRVAEIGDRVVQRVGRYQQQLHVLGEMNHTIACDISVTCAELGYEPRVELYDGMRRSIRWCVEQGLEL